MRIKIVNFTKLTRGQLKIQEMAFVIVGLVIFFGIVALFVINLSLSGLKEEAQTLKDEGARQLLRTLASSPEFTWIDGNCPSCVDKDKLFILKRYAKNYSDFWKVDYLAIEIIYPNRTGECTDYNYPECKTITLINKSEYFGVPSEAYVSVCSKERLGIQKCDLGKIYASIRRTG